MTSTPGFPASAPIRATLASVVDEYDRRAL